MKINNKVLAVFFGGCSPEYEVSLQSAYGIITHVDREDFQLVLIGIHRETGQWYLYNGAPERIPIDCWYSKENCIPVFLSMDKTHHGLYYIGRSDKHGSPESIIEIKGLSLDAALPVLHGKNGEDGTLQGALELAGIPVIGCGILSSALCMDKELAHRIAEAAGVRTAKCLVIQHSFDRFLIKNSAGELGYPLFVKPLRAGSSFGISMVLKEEDLMTAIENAFLHDSQVLLEEAIPGFEVGCAILGTKDPIIGEVDEIELSDGFFDYTEKYTLKTSNIHVPARISPEKADQIKKTALTVYRALGCSGFARVDMFLTPEGFIYFNEVNTIPGFTSHSRFPNMLKASGLSFRKIINRLLEMED